MPEAGSILLCAGVSALQVSPKAFSGGGSGPGRRQNTTPHLLHGASTAAPLLPGSLIASFVTRTNNSVEGPCVRQLRRYRGCNYFQCVGEISREMIT